MWKSLSDTHCFFLCLPPHTNIYVHVIEKLLQVALLIKPRKMKKIWCPYPEIHTYRRGNHDLANQYTVNARFVVLSLTVYVQQIFCLLCSTTSHYKTTRLLQTVNIELIIKCPYQIWQLATIQFYDIKWFLLQFLQEKFEDTKSAKG